MKYAACAGIGASAFNALPIITRYAMPNPSWPASPGSVAPGPVKVADLNALTPGTFKTFVFNFGKVPLKGGIWSFDEKIKHQSGAENKGVGENIVAYSLLCTHLGCFAQMWNSSTKILACPCHNGQYDMRDAAKVVGGPPPAAIPEIKLENRKGEIFAAGWKDESYVKTLQVYRNRGVV